MSTGFSGEVAALYQRYRHGYREPTVSAIIETLALSGRDLGVDLGCGTGQLTLPLARRLRAMIGIDPEPDMLTRARQLADRARLRNTTWVLGGDHDLRALLPALGHGSLGVLTVAQALHWMDAREVFSAARPLLRVGGGIAIITNGTPLWLQDSDWSRAVRAFLERWLGHALTAPCGTDHASQQRYGRLLQETGYELVSTAHDYLALLSFDELLGGILSAMPAKLLPSADQRSVFAAGLRAAVAPTQRFDEPVHVALLIGRVPCSPRS